MQSVRVWPPQVVDLYQHQTKTSSLLLRCLDTRAKNEQDGCGNGICLRSVTLVCAFPPGVRDVCAVDLRAAAVKVKAQKVCRRTSFILEKISAARGHNQTTVPVRATSQKRLN